MKKISPRQLSLLLSCTVFATVGNGLSAQAQTADTIRMNNASQHSLNSAIPTVPTPGTTATSAATLTPEAVSTPTATESTAETNAPRVAQILPGQSTRGGSSYIGVGGNIGLGGDSDLGDSSFTVLSKIGFTNAIAVRPSVLIGDDPTILIPITYDFSIQPADAFTEPLPIAPYVGAGIGITTGDGGEVGPIVTGGVDFPLNPQFTATAAVNVGFFDDVAVGILAGIGYNFTGF